MQHDRADSTSDVLLAAGFAVLVLKFAIYPLVRTRAFDVTISEDISRVKELKPGFGFVGPSPGWDARGIYQVLTHLPVYLVVFTRAILVFPFFLVPWIFDRKDADRIQPTHVFELCIHSSLVMLGRFQQDGTYMLEMPEKCPRFLKFGANCDPAGLRIVFNSTGTKILSATCFGEDIVGSPDCGRNEVLIAALRCVLAHWIHPTIHVYSEMCALSIQKQRIHELEPSAHFVSALHEGLLHGPLSPLERNSNPFFCGTGSQSELISSCSAFPVPPHNIAKKKQRFEFYNFAVEGRKIVQDLVRSHRLDIDPEVLFMNLIMHAIDHECSYRVLGKLPLYSIDGSGSLISCWQAYMFTHAWLRHTDNVLNSDLLRNNLEQPFYRKLYDRLGSINPQLTERIVVSCCF